MSNIKILCFPLRAVADPFNVETTNLNKLKIGPIDWTANDSQILSESLNNQVKNMYLLFRTLKIACDRTRNVQFLGMEMMNGELAPIFYSLTPEQEQEGCSTFAKRAYYYQEIFSRDQDALTSDEVTAQLYAIVLFKDSIYQGHIYSWISPIDSNYCFALGIRNRPDAIFLQYSNRILPKIAFYLIEGVRRFALTQKAKNVVIPFPQPVMKRILPSMGFSVTENLPVEITFGGLAPNFGAGTCLSCYEYSDLNRNIISDAIDFKFISE